MFKRFVIICLIYLPFLGFSQDKVDIRKGVVSKNGATVFILRNISPILLEVKSLDGSRLAVVQYVSNPNSTTVLTKNNTRSSSTTSSTSSSSSYCSITFMDSSLSKCEIPMTTKKGLAKEFIHFNLIVDNGLNVEEINRYVRIYGNRYSDSKNSTIFVNP